MKKQRHRKLRAKLRAHEVFADFKYRLILDGIIVGILTGAVVSLFRLVLSYADTIRNKAISFAAEGGCQLLTVLALLILLLAATGLIIKKIPMTTGSGIPQVKGELKGEMDPCWWKVLAGKFAGGILAITAGLSLGREGPSIQLGAMVGKGLSEKSDFLKGNKKTLMTCGAGAGLAAAFSAPLAGVIFTMEELQKRYTTETMLSTMAAAITADWVASSMFGLSPVFNISPTPGLPLARYWEVLILGLVLGAFGAAYNRCIAISQDLFGKLKSPYLKMAAAAAMIIIAAVFYPKVLGSGHSLVDATGSGEFGFRVLIVLLIIKFIYSILSFGTGAPGGIFLPLLVIGAVTGGCFAKLAGMLPMIGNDYVSLFAVLGMAGYFSAIVRAPLTGIVLISEMTGVSSNLLPLAVVSFAAYVTAEFCYAVPIYDQLLYRMLNGKPQSLRHSRMR